MGIKYRNEIDGLRAIAVLLVVFNHLGVGFLKGGYVGVDVFFVISGFLITSIIKSEIENKEFTFANFYKKRILRLAPAYFLVLACTTLTMLFLAAPQQLLTYIKSVIYSSFFAANFFMWRELGGYFSSNADFTPLLHLWSLGVEEQFYILFPIVLILLTKFIPKFRLFLIVFALLISVALSQYFAVNIPSTAYFLLPFRAFELLIGSTLAFIAVRDFNDSITNTATALGLSLILIPSFIFDEKTIFPGVKALFPCIGTALVIYFARVGVFKKVLSSKYMAFFGKISYPMYLWHWPLIVFLNFYFIEINFLVGLTVFVLTTLLSWGTYKYVENYFKEFRKSKPLRVITKGYLVPLSLIILGGFYITKSEGLPQRFDQGVIEKEKALYTKAHKIRANCIERSPNELSNPNECSLGVEKEKIDLLLIGDSHANHFSAMIDVLAKDANIRGYEITQNSSFFLPNVNKYTNKDGEEFLFKAFKTRNDLLIDLINENDFKYVVLAGSYANSYTDSIFKLKNGESSRDTFLRGLKDAIDLIKKSGAKPIIILGSPKLTKYDQTCSLRNEMYHLDVDCNIPREEHERHFKKWKEDILLLKKYSPDLLIIDPTKVMCDSKTCKTDIEGTPLYVDSGHLNYTGSALIGKLYLNKFGNPLITK